MTNHTTSLHAVGLVIIGLFACSIAPPIGLLFFVAAYFVQRHFRQRDRVDTGAKRMKAQEKLDREKILAARSMQ